MIQDIHPHTFSNQFKTITSIQKNDYIFHFKNDSLLLKQVGEELEIPKKKYFKQCSEEGIFLFTLNNINCFLIWDCQIDETSGLLYHEFNYFRTINQKEIEWSSVLAYQLMNWYSNNMFCGKCGSKTELSKTERAINCPLCQTNLFPPIAPAIIVAILSKDKILLARGVNFRNNMYSLVAGYVDIGETIEETVVREVKEEIGIDVTNIRYYKSQPWPYSGSMMIAFIADGDETQTINIDKNEIADAAWFNKTNLPNYPTNRSIAGEIIEKFIRGEL